MGRVTLLYEPFEQFDARLSVAHSNLHSRTVFLQPIYCPRGSYQPGDTNEDCRLDFKTNIADLGPNLAAQDPRYGDGVPFLDLKQTIGSFRMNYRPVEGLTITSITGLYRVDSTSVDNYVPTASAARSLANRAEFFSHEFSQEARAQTDLGGPFDMLLGGYFQTSKAKNAGLPYFGTLNPVVPASNNDYRVSSKTYSAFGQLVVRPVPTLELAGGARYTGEHKHLDVFLFRLSDNMAPIKTIRPDVDFDNISPEASITWRPTKRVTAYANYKQGFLSGNFNSGSGNPAEDRSYKPQSTAGYEAGLKASLLGGKLRFNGQAFSYTVTDLQVTSVQLVPDTPPRIAQIVSNAGKLRSKGAEADVTWRGLVPGLTLRGAIAYTHARYKDFVAPCYTGQTITGGCNLNTQGGQFRAQSLAGQQVVRSPDWAGNVSADYDTAISETLRIGIGADMSLSSSYFGDANNNPFVRLKNYQLFNASIRLHPEEKGWNLALIGRNLANKAYTIRTVEILGTGIAGRTGTDLTGGRADIAGEVARGREVIVQVGYKF